MAAYEEIILLSILSKKKVYTIEYSCPIKGRGQSKHCPRPFLIRQLSSAFATTFWQVLNELEQEDCWHSNCAFYRSTYWRTLRITDEGYLFDRQDHHWMKTVVLFAN